MKKLFLACLATGLFAFGTGSAKAEVTTAVADSNNQGLVRTAQMQQGDTVTAEPVQYRRYRNYYRNYNRPYRSYRSYGYYPRYSYGYSRYGYPRYGYYNSYRYPRYYGYPSYGYGRYGTGYRGGVYISPRGLSIGW